MIAIVDYGMANLRSVEKALAYAGADPVVTSDPRTVAAAGSVVLPGVGAFCAAMGNLCRSGLRDAVVDSIQAGKPFLGICLGLQMLFDASTEMGASEGLGLLAGKVERFFEHGVPPGAEALKVPHIGWNALQFPRESRLMQGVEPGARVYFVHSYFPGPEDATVTSAVCDYGGAFCCAVERDNVAATQFHPEKSGAVGLQILPKLHYMALSSGVGSGSSMIVFPAIDLKEGRCVRLRQGSFDDVTHYDDDPLNAARRWRDEGAEWLHIVDLDGARHGVSNSENVEIVARVVREVGLPVQLGGGVRSLEIAERLLNVGVARVVAGTAVARDAFLAESLFNRLGDRVAVGVDARDGRVAVQGWQEHIGESATAFIERMQQLGAVRFIFTDISRDGMLTGVNVPSLAQVAAVAPTARIIASGGVSDLRDIEALLHLQTSGAPNLEGVIVGKALYAGTVTLPEILARVRAAR